MARHICMPKTRTGTEPKIKAQSHSDMTTLLYAQYVPLRTSTGRSFMLPGHVGSSRFDSREARAQPVRL
eukprot:3015999-Amphidinium_carterae.1